MPPDQFTLKSTEDAVPQNNYVIVHKVMPNLHTAICFFKTAAQTCECFMINFQLLVSVVTLIGIFFQNTIAK